MNNKESTIWYITHEKEQWTHHTLEGECIQRNEHRLTRDPSKGRPVKNFIEFLKMMKNNEGYTAVSAKDVIADERRNGFKCKTYKELKQHYDEVGACKTAYHILEVTNFEYENGYTTDNAVPKMNKLDLAERLCVENK